MSGTCIWVLTKMVRIGIRQGSIGEHLLLGQWGCGRCCVCFSPPFSAPLFQIRQLILAPHIAGFIRAVKGQADGNGWDHLYDMSYFFGFFVSLLCYWGFHAAFPVDRQTGESPFVLDQHVLVTQEGDGASSSGRSQKETMVLGEKGEMA